MLKHVLRPWRRASASRAVGLGALLVIAALGVGTAPASAKSKLTTVNVGVDPLWLSAPPYVCQSAGICKTYGLKVNPVQVTSTAAMVAAIQAGSMQFGVGSLAAELQAYAAGLGIKMLAPNGGLTPTLGAAAVAWTSSITSPQQLAGTTYCEETIGGQAQAQVEYMLQQAGVDPKSVKFIGVPYPNMVQALQNGQCTAADLESPFLNQALAQHQVKVVGNEDKLFGPAGSPVTAYFTSSAYASKSATTTKNFVAAMIATQKYIAKHPSAMTKVLPSFTGVTPAQAKKTPVGLFPNKFNVSLLQTVANRFVEFGLVTKQVNVRGILYKGAPIKH